MGRRNRQKPAAPQANKSSVFNRLGAGAARRNREVDANLTVSVQVGGAVPRTVNTNANRKPPATLHQGLASTKGIDLRERINARKGEREAATLEDSGSQGGLGESRKINEALASRLGERKATNEPEVSFQGNDGGGSALLCPLCDTVFIDLAEHNRTPGHVREEEKQQRTGVFRCKRCVEEFPKQENLALHLISPGHQERAERRIRHALEEGGGQPLHIGDRQGSADWEAGPMMEAGAGLRNVSWTGGQYQMQKEGAVRQTLQRKGSQREGNDDFERSESDEEAEYSERKPNGTSGGVPPGMGMTGGMSRREKRRLADRLDTGGKYSHRADPSQGPEMSVEGDRFNAKRPRRGEDDDDWRQRRDTDEGGRRDGRSRREEGRNRLAQGLREAEILTRAEQGREGGKGRVREEKGEQRGLEPQTKVFHDAEDGDWPEREPEPIYEEWQEEAAGLGGPELSLQRKEADGEGFTVGEEYGLARAEAHQDDWLELRLAPTLHQEGGQQNGVMDREAEDPRELAEPGALTDRWAGGEELETEDRRECSRIVSPVSGRNGRGKGLAEASDGSGPPGFQTVQTERTFTRRSELGNAGMGSGIQRGRVASDRTGLFANGREVVNGRVQELPDGLDRTPLHSTERERAGEFKQSQEVYDRTAAAVGKSELVRKAIERRAQTDKVIRGELPRGLRPGIIDDEGFEVLVTVQEAVEGGVSLPGIEAPLSIDNYCDKMALLYQVEEAQMQLDITEFDQVVTLQTSGRGLMLEVQGLAERKPSVAKGDKILLSKGRRSGLAAPKYLVYAHDVDLAKRAIFTQQAYLDADREYLVQFTVRREPIVRAVRSLQLCRSAVGSELRHLLFPGQAPDHLENGDLPRFEPRDTVLNTEQRQVVASIVQRTQDVRKDVPPFVIFGPPGTGKTKTMVEAIVQVREARPDARVLVCAPSNSAADNLLEQLYNSSRQAVRRADFKADVIRINSAGRPKEGVGALPEALADFATYNPSTGFYTAPQPRSCSQHVFITTCSAAALLHQRSFPRGFFSHIFIDEAGHAVEPECFVPLACFATRETVVALAGDHQQLGPVVRSPLARKHGLGVSYLERLCGLPLYSPEDNKGRYVGYRTSVIRKLVRNYRSHPDILQIPSEVFYHGELDASADEEARESLSTWRELPTKGFPIIFHGLASADDREGDSPSWYNEGESKQVMWYIDRLLDCRKPRITHFDIGVVAPYRRQVQKLQRLLDARGRSAVRVGTVEDFQGQEKRVVIVTTVRAEHGADGEPRDVPGDVRRGLGFLGRRKRFNVAMTRAKELLIIVGNPHVLKQDPLWARMLRYCIIRGGYQSKHCPPPPNEEIDVRLEPGQGLANSSAEEGSVFEGHVESPEWPEPV